MSPNRTPVRIDNTDDVIDSRDVIARIEYLQEQEPADLWEHERAELPALLALAAQGESLDDWEHGVALVRHTHFTSYAEQRAEDIGDYDRSRAQWPYTCIDWEQAARELAMDYTELDFGGVSYLAR